MLTASMEPSLPPGTLVVVRPVDPAEIGVGDVITDQVESGRPTVITHRVIGVGTRSDGERVFTTLGDNNAEPDPTVRAVQVQGRVWYSLPWLGRLVPLRDQGIWGVVLPVAGVGLLLYGGFLVVSGLRDRLRRTD